MENFNLYDDDINTNAKKLEGSDMVDLEADDTSMKVSVSPVCVKDGQKVAYVVFEEGKKRAEGRIPDCIILENKGFSEEEVAALCLYMKSDLKRLKDMAAKINVLDAFMK